MSLPSGLVADARGQDAKRPALQITAVDPASLVVGSRVTWKLRGFELKQATAIRFPAASGVDVQLKEAGDAAPVKGLENRLAGDTQIVAELTLPADFPTGLVVYTVITPAGEVSGKVKVCAADTVVDEKEPNDAFRAAQELSIGKLVRGNLQSDKDVDVFAFPARAGQQLKVSVTSGGQDVMDAEIHCYDARGQFLAAGDDQETRDPVVMVTTQNDETVLVCVSSAHDVGGPWQSYWLSVEEVK